jgi:hypothetical protein
MRMMTKMASGERPAKDTFTLKEREAWTYDAELTAIEAKLIRRYRIKSTGELEHAMVHQMRLVYYEVLLASLGDYVYLANDIYVGDVRQLWCAVSAVAQENSAMSLHRIEQAIRLHEKTEEITFPVWVMGLDAYYAKMHMLRSPKADRQKVMDVIFLLIDKRYKSVQTSITHDARIGYEAVKIKLKAKALEISDIEPRPKNIENTTSANATEGRDSDSGDESNEDGIDHGDRTEGGRNGDGTDHGDLTEDGRHDKDGGRDSRGGGGKGGNTHKRGQICLYHLAGSCAYGDDCFNQHLTLKELKEAYKGGQASSQKKGEADSDVCYQWRDHGACKRGDACRFEHSSSSNTTARDWEDY